MRINFVILAAIAAGTFAQAQFFGVVPQLPNAPFSAEMESANVQTLADGTHISHGRQKSMVYRDSLGRTRTEVFSTPGFGSQQAQPIVTNITIVDPVEGARYILNPNSKTAQKFVVQARPQGSAALPANSQGRATAAPMGMASSVRVTPAGTSVTGGVPANGRPRPQSKDELLGTQTIEGVLTDGRRITTTWAEGTIGNDRDVVTSNEIWQSTELGITMLSTNSDPRSGERTTKVVNLSRTEPDPALFQVPSDYTIEEPQKSAGPSGTQLGTAR